MKLIKRGRGLGLPLLHKKVRKRENVYQKSIDRTVSNNNIGVNIFESSDSTQIIITRIS